MEALRLRSDTSCWFGENLLVIMENACTVTIIVICFFFQAEDGIRNLVRSRGLGDVYKRQA